MKRSIILGKVKGIQIEIHISWLLAFVLTAYVLADGYFPQNYPDWVPALRWVLGGLIAFMLLISILLHELSHSIVSQRLGLQVKRITLFIFGGIAQIEKEPDHPAKEFKVAIAGPAMSILLFALFKLFSTFSAFLAAPEYFTVFFSYLSSVNLAVAVFNLVPAFPLDGGRILRSVLWHFSGDLEKSTRISSTLGRWFGYFLIFYGMFGTLTGNILNGIWLIFIGFFIIQAAELSYEDVIISDLFSKKSVREFMTEKIVIVDAAISVKDLVDHYFLKYKYFMFPVNNQEEITGVVSLDNVKKIPQNTWEQAEVGSIATPLDDNLIVSPDESVSAAMNKLFANQFGRVLVMDNGKLIGIVSRTDILNYIRINSKLKQ